MIKIKPQKVRRDKLAIAAYDGKIGLRFGEAFYYRYSEGVVKIDGCPRCIELAEWIPPTKLTTKSWVEMKRLLCFDEGPYYNRLMGHLPDSEFFYTEWNMRQFFLRVGKEWDENETCSSTIYLIAPADGVVYGSVCRGLGFDPRLLEDFIPTREELIEILREV